MKTNFSYSNASNVNISFNIHQDQEEIEPINSIFDKKNHTKEVIKRKFPEQKIFRINSFIFNDEKENQELYAKYDCIYAEKNNSLYLIINEKVNYSDFTKDKLINILDFSNSIGISVIYILINKRNKNYKNFIQDMLIVGFNFDKNFPNFTIDGQVYKPLKMSIKDITQEIKQINLI